MLVGAHLDNVDQPPESSYRRLRLMRAEVALTLWTAGTRHKRPVYQKLREVGVGKVCIRVGDERVAGSVDDYLTDVDQALNEAVAAGFREEDVDLQLLNETNLQPASPGSVGIFLDAVCRRWRRKARVVVTPVSRGVPGWLEYARQLVGAMVNLPKGAAYAYHAYREQLADLLPCDPAGVPVVVTEFGHPDLSGAERGRWVVEQLSELSRKGYDYACQFIVGGEPHGAWPKNYVMTDAEAAVIGARGPLPMPESPQPTAPTPVPPEPAQEIAPMHKRAYLHQFDQLGEKSVAEIAATLRLADIREVACKTHQEFTWLGRATNGDTSPLAFRSLEDVAKRHAEFKAEGIRMVPWCVPMGTDARREANQAADVAGACDGVVELDTEPYKEFWEGPYNLLLPYSDVIQERGARYEVNFDARPTGWHPFTAAQFSAVCADSDAVWTQSYWSTFGADAADVVKAALEVLDVLEVPVAKRGVIFPWDGPADYERALALVVAGGIGRLGMWRMGTAGPAVYAALAKVPTSESPEQPTTTDPKVDALNGLWQRLDEAEAAADAAKAAVKLAREEAVDLKRAVGVP